MPDTVAPNNPPTANELLERFLRVEREAATVSYAIVAVRHDKLIRFQETKSSTRWGIFGFYFMYVVCAVLVAVHTLMLFPIVGAVVSGAFAVGLIYWLMTWRTQPTVAFDIDTDKEQIIVPGTGGSKVIDLNMVERFFGWRRYHINKHEHGIFVVTADGNMQELVGSAGYEGTKRITAPLGFICNKPADFRDEDGKLTTCFSPGTETFEAV